MEKYMHLYLLNINRSLRFEEKEVADLSWDTLYYYDDLQPLFFFYTRPSGGIQSSNRPFKPGRDNTSSMTSSKIPVRKPLTGMSALKGNTMTVKGQSNNLLRFNRALHSRNFPHLNSRRLSSRILNRWSSNG